MIYQNYFDRPYFLNWLWQWKDKDMIKVVTGIRRCGKSVLLKLHQKKLLESRVRPERIISVDFEDPDFEFLKTVQDVWAYLKERIDVSEKNYVFLDEVQRIPEFEKLVDGLFVRKYIDVYITGSNAYMLSGELATFLSGRYVEIKLHPLSFKEYFDAAEETDYMRCYNKYITTGGFPYLLSFGNDKGMIHDYLAGIYNTILMKDIVARKGLRDTSVLERVIRFVFDNIGNLANASNISNSLTSAGSKTTYNTVEAYLSALCETFMIYHVNRYDVKGKDILKSGGKYYIADLGLRNFLLGGTGDEGRILENIVYLELLRRNRNVYIGKVGSAEVDFVTRDGDDIRYYQVALTVRTSGTLERELASLKAIRDNHPKYLLTLDNAPQISHDGIEQIFVLDWLLS